MSLRKIYRLITLKIVFNNAVFFLAINVFRPSTSDNGIWTSWRNPYPDCVNAEYEYELYEENNGQLVRSGVTFKNGFTLPGMQCDTRYKLQVRYRTSTKIGEENWFSVKTGVSCEFFYAGSCTQLHI